MARVACRWPGGINLHIKKTGVPAERWPQFRLQGPSGKIESGGDPLRSPRAAQAFRQNHLSKLKELYDTQDKPLHQMDYVENYVPDHFWREWVDQQGHTHTHQHKIVFEIEPPPPPADPPAPVRSRKGEVA